MMIAPMANEMRMAMRGNTRAPAALPKKRRNAGGRELSGDPDVIIASQPTRGVDVGAIEFIHGQLLKQRAEGKAILLISLELDEVRSLSDRIVVIYAGEIVGEVGPEATDEELGLLMAGRRERSA